MENNENKVVEEKTESKKSDKGRILYLILLLVVFAVCYVFGYNIVSKLSDDKDKEKEKVEEKVDDKTDNNEEDKDENDETNVDEEQEPSNTLSEEDALKLAEERYQYGRTALNHSAYKILFSEVKEIEGQECYKLEGYEAVRNNFAENNQVKFIRTEPEFKSFETDIKLVDGEYYIANYGDRGNGQNYRGTEFEVVEMTETTIKLNANVHFCKEYGSSDENCETETVVDDFILVKENDIWKISKMTNPN